MANVFITTIDNPFDPFEQFEDWNRFDEDHGYFTLSYLERVANTNWVAINEVPYSDFQSDLNALRNKILIYIF